MAGHGNQTRMLALAVYQIRILLSGYLGSMNDLPLEVRQAAHLAYALHNEALALLEGGDFDVEHALQRVSAVDRIFSTRFTDLFSEITSPSDSL